MGSYSARVEIGPKQDLVYVWSRRRRVEFGMFDASESRMLQSVTLGARHAVLRVCLEGESLGVSLQNCLESIKQRQVHLIPPTHE